MVFGADYEKKFSFDRSVFKSHSTYREIWQYANRVNFRGVYIRSEKYIKVGERQVQNSRYDVVKCKFYRYIRFLPDGRVVMLI